MTTELSSPLVFLIAGENSGDALGASLMGALRDKTHDKVRFAGVGGPEMTAEGLSSLFPMQDLAVMGVFEVIPKLPTLLRRMGETADEIERLKPDVLITIDAPDFCFRVIKKIKARSFSIPIVHYVAPSVWAWRSGRAAKVAKFLDHLLCLLPFEPPYFHAVGLDATFVGHPVVTRQIDEAGRAAFRSRHAIGAETKVMCVLPGSRSGEVERLLEVFGETMQRLYTHIPDLVVVIPAVAHLHGKIAQTVSSWAVPTHVVGQDEKAEAYVASDAALAASGTVTLELAMAGVVHVIGYRVNALTAFLGRLLIKTPYANLINICLHREAVPEFIQDQCTADNLAQELERLLTDERARTAQRHSAIEALTQLGLGGPPPGDRAADVVLSVLHQALQEEN
ncbi:lipid-A-disaccharide synthase [Magnetovibrio blakemorei]|uniref:Lipid-A-disaccharide synthase n=1 Tax=Magnetovibrio blakemorei TaxID=28181 RepID=A0A1E5Q935_9PROT|nr:lipid-A-disaccharide synthase [Magnetovibrio blakemorei]OEJ68004.1 lipid-A-disaccharide synthase [Magnetovibrio blakemorei]